MILIIYTINKMFSYYSYLITSLVTSSKFYSFTISNTIGYIDDFRSQDIAIKYNEDVPIIQLRKDLCDSYFDEIGVNCNEVKIYKKKDKDNKIVYQAHSDVHLEFNADLFFSGFAEIRDDFRVYTNNFYETKSGDGKNVEKIEIKLIPKSPLSINLINGFLCHSMYWGIILVSYFIFVHLLNIVTFLCDNPDFIFSQEHINKIKTDFLFASFIFPITIMCIIFGYYLIFKKIYIFIKGFCKECFYKRILFHKINKYTTEHQFKEVGHNCSICLNDIEKNGTKTDCNHIFHADCIGKWLFIKNSCPLCRTEIII